MVNEAMREVSLPVAATLTGRTVNKLRRKVESGKLLARLEDDSWMVDVRALQAMYPEAARSDVLGYLEMENQRLIQQLDERERQLEGLRLRLMQMERELGEQQGMARVHALMEGPREPVVVVAPPVARPQRVWWPWLLVALSFVTSAAMLLHPH